jgi:3-deoxy-manno-octulosonate cytidylyltransferase (CMP-KDO synthetase)
MTHFNMPLNILCVIPSRIGSTRLPRKPLLPIQGKPMIQWTYENAKRCHLLTDLVVATDSDEIADVIVRIGGKVEITSPDLPTGTERVADVAKRYPADVVINLQGDEPFIKPSMLEKVVAPYLSGGTPDMTTLATPLDKENKYHEPGAVKVITDRNGNAIYFSRSPIPYYRTPQSDVPVYHHMGLYAFRHDFLMHYQRLLPTPLEKAEQLEQLRVLEHGYKIQVCLIHEKTLEINTPEEYAQAQQFQYIT